MEESLKLKRFAVNLLFVFRVDGVTDDEDWMCESRIVIVRALKAKDALEKARKKGKEAEWDGENDEGNKTRSEFVGVMELLCLEGVAEDEDEVWYDVLYVKDPSALVPSESDLNAIMNKD